MSAHIYDLYIVTVWLGDQTDYFLLLFLSQVKKLRYNIVKFIYLFIYLFFIYWFFHYDTVMHLVAKKKKS